MFSLGSFIVHEDDTHKEVQEEKRAKKNEKQKVQRVVRRTILLAQRVVNVLETLRHILYYRPALERCDDE